MHAAVMHAMDLLKKQYGILFGTSICYTSANIKAASPAMTSCASHTVRQGAHFGFYFHYMPVSGRK